MYKKSLLIRRIAEPICAFFVLLTAFICVKDLLAEDRLLGHGCNSQNTYIGLIDPKFVQFLNNMDGSTTLCLSISGGSERNAFSSVSIIRRKRITAIIFGECTSACVDFLLPSFSRVLLVHTPSVLTHGNPVYREILRLRFNGVTSGNTTNDVHLTDFCISNAQRLRQIWQDSAVNADALHRLTDLLQPTSLRGRPNGCPTINFTGGLFSLRKSELEMIFGHKFEGETCADNNTCFNESLRAAEKAELAGLLRSP
jgi:hypothetical protein